ncbi:LOW QUALITY PROTEIN: WD repeat domain phosphoinositide-interacting protein 2-like [Suncus etruscus]|uniref:LOW QUALITY PROTEIN: WD repeat domain phosphoinositide-interacting protein 2-like n=1 Tax=Suncus etruscus TaxID=109475 RepID=UPI002110CB00|nr:LOW QUALITY PROTEIN: WD repeat domain phosphoinositide-interacting protein 2-like [Suncus etruscus]
MNLAGPGVAGSGPFLYANFNQDLKALQMLGSAEAQVPPGGATPKTLVLGSQGGSCVYSLASVEELDVLYECTEVTDVCLVESLFSGREGLVALVSLQAPRKLRVYNTRTRKEFCAFSYSSKILAVKASPLRLLVCLEESLFIYTLWNLDLLHIIKETPSNPDGVCALSATSYLAYPGSASFGKVQVFDATHLRASTTLLAHDSPVAALAFDLNGTKLATASEKGTVIRVFSIPEGQKLHEFRRGLKRCVAIYSLAFSSDGAFLASSSNTETVHVFKLQSEEEKLEESATWCGYLGKALLASSPYLPSPVSQVFSQDRAFATVHLPFCGHRNICALATIQKVLRLLVAAADGYLYIYQLDPQDGGNCTLMKQHQLFDGVEITSEILDLSV